MSHFPEIVSKEPERRKSFENSIQPSRENVNRSRASFEAVPSNLRTYAVQSFGLSNGELGVISSSRKSIAKLDELLRKASRSSQGREPINRSREQIFDQSSESECPIWLTTCGIRSKALTRYRPQSSSPMSRGKSVKSLGGYVTDNTKEFAPHQQFIGWKLVHGIGPHSRSASAGDIHTAATTETM